MNRTELVAQIRQKKSMLCVGLDTDPQKIPGHLSSEKDPVLAFNKAIIDATQHVAVAYKINIAFYEALGPKGWETLQQTLDYIPRDCFTIADAKRGDIGNTADQYARAFFETYPFDSVTVAPYMGADSVQPFLKYQDKWAIVLGLTSNEGSKDFQLQRCGDEFLYEKVLTAVSGWGSPDNLMFVIGATRSEQLQHVREMLPHHFLLIPGVGAQGGDVPTVCRAAMNEEGGLLINVSRGIIYAGKDEDFARAAQQAAEEFQRQMAAFL